jgi:hypothetical protein
MFFPSALKTLVMPIFLPIKPFIFIYLAKYARRS